MARVIIWLKVSLWWNFKIKSKIVPKEDLKKMINYSTISLLDYSKRK